MSDAAPSARTQQQRLKDLLGERVHPALRAEGFRRSGNTWWRGSREDGWVLVQVQGSKYNTAESVELTVNTEVWPPAAFEEQGRVAGWGPAARPSISGWAPFAARPQDLGLNGPGSPDVWWVLTDDVDADRLGRELAELVVGRALPWAVERLDPWRAAGLLLEEGRVWSCVSAIATLRHAGAPPERLREAVEALTARWVPDPRPITLRPHVAAYRAEVGLPPVDLPEVWSPSMAPSAVARFGSPEAARAAGHGVWMHHWDGRSWVDRPGG